MIGILTERRRGHLEDIWSQYVEALVTQVENEKSRKYDLIANELSLIYKCKVKIIPYVITWDGLATKYHKKYRKEIGIQPKTEAYIQSLVLKKTLESVSFERRRGLEEYTMKLRHCGIIPIIQRLGFEGIKGYATGCLFGILTPSKDSLGRCMHKNGKKIAKMSLAYAATEMVLEKVRGKDCPSNKIFAGATAGAIGSKHGIIPGMVMLGGYSGLENYFEAEPRIENKK
ncbi:hypothetical protein ACJJTC_016836 [Scirpophaga incertulas]